METAVIPSVGAWPCARPMSCTTKIGRPQESPLLNGRLQLIVSCWLLILETAVPPHLRRKSTDSQRRIMRTYGATFGYLEGEATDPDDQGEDVMVE